MKKNKKGFTLIELLVVVLIIGVIAGVGISSYQKAAEKSKAAQALTILKAINNAFINYYNENRDYPKDFESLNVTLPASFNIDEKFVPNSVTFGKSNGEWNISFERYANNSVLSITIVRTKGKYQGAGFYVSYVQGGGTRPPRTILCYERKSSAIYLFNSKLKAGAYCEGVMGAKELILENVYTRLYKMN